MSTAALTAAHYQTPPPPGTRAVLRLIEAGCMDLCAHCHEQIKFAAKPKKSKVIANVYEGNRWIRVEHFHEACYEETNQPFGKPDTSLPVRRSPSLVKR